MKSTKPENNTFENETNENLVEIIRTAMEHGCIRPCHVYDAVDELLHRFENKKEEAERKHKEEEEEEAERKHQKIVDYYMGLVREKFGEA